ncbi:beta-ketoacyl synthase [Caulobacter sp. SLTY]|uniref:beta-ketoacyl synthase N-terminal-like domain-containing protein n=1 Tax=Caulobacter sp. SLTY TaxID=2683262 RepID=UPI001412B60F|nr:beta-ketoacyl synthase N-terminal-like domain-containing protein [Caulobacter sp. SLTY]NBB14234.1 beta-ketoacyl synthase [Caulobacter sp. SLTY]
MRRAWFLGAGLHTTLGRGLPANLAALPAGPPEPGFTDVPLGEGVERTPTMLLADLPLEDVGTRLWRALEPVVEEAIAASGLTPAELERAALFLGSSSLDVSVSEAAYAQDLLVDPDARPLMANVAMGGLADTLRRRFGLRGPDFTVNTACTSSANALIYADAMIAEGLIDHALIVGLEIFNVITALGFQSLALLAPNGMRPFDPARAGLVLGEAAAALVVGAAPGPSRFRLIGGANLCDTHAVSAANPDGTTVAAVMRQALADAGLTTSDILAVKAHGTASLLNDEAEAAGIQQVFDDIPPLLAMKPFIGHTFGACGLAELLLVCAAAEAGRLPPHPGISATPGDLGLALNQTWAPVGRGAFLLNYFGFGGNNTSLVLAND